MVNVFIQIVGLFLSSYTRITQDNKTNCITNRNNENYTSCLHVVYSETEIAEDTKRRSFGVTNTLTTTLSR